MALISGDYRVHSCYSIDSNGRNYVLNLDSGKVTNGTRIYTTKPDGTREQIWYYVNKRLYTEAQDSQYRTLKCLDRLNTSANYADIYDDNDDDNQLITLEQISFASRSTYRIKLTNKNLYLTTSAATGVGSCTWTPLISEDSPQQQWIFERVYRITDMPRTGTYAANIEYFSGCTSWNVDGSFNDHHRDIRARVKNLYNMVSTGRLGNKELSDSNCLYNLPGALACSQGDSLDGYYHMGIDMVYSGDIHPYKDGVVVGHITMAQQGYTATGIRHTFGNEQYVFWYLHLEFPFDEIPVDSYVTTSTVIGTVASHGAQSKHLHIECQHETSTSPSVPSQSKLHVNENYFGAYDLLDFIDE